MIILIRKLRQELMAGNRLRKFAFYALAELFLVVAGILIALQINTWSEERKQQKLIASIYTIVKSDLESDIQSFGDISGLIGSNKEYYQKIMDGEMTREDYNTCNNCVHLLAGYPDVIIEKRGYNLLVANSTLFNPEKDSLFIKINQFYKKHDLRISVSQSELFANHNDNWFYWKTKMPWFSTYFRGETNDEIIDYMLNDPDYVNRVTATHFLLYQKLLLQLAAFRKEAQDLIAEIDN